jgi:hypothetical protein
LSWRLAGNADQLSSRTKNSDSYSKRWRPTEIAIGAAAEMPTRPLIFSIIRRSNAADIVALRIARLPDRDEHGGGDDTEGSRQANPDYARGTRFM